MPIDPWRHVSRTAPLDCTALSDANYTHSDAASQGGS